MKNLMIMRCFNIFVTGLLMILSACVYGQDGKTANFYGEEFQISQNMDVDALGKALNKSNLVHAQLTGTIKEVCQAKGCWMKVQLDNNQEVFVRFKDYGFFVPTDSSDKNVVIKGAIFQETVSVEDQRHYAKDKGDSPEKIAEITTPKQQLRFEAEGVLIYNLP